MGTFTDPYVEGSLPDPNSNRSLQEGPRFRLDLARSLRMRRNWAVAAGIVTLALLTLFGISRKRFYQASSLIYVQPVIPRFGADGAAAFYDSARYDAYIQQQLLMFHRPDILGHALDQLPPDLRRALAADNTAAIKQLDDGVAAERPAGSYQIKVTMEAGNPFIVAPIANAVAAAYLQEGQQDDLALGEQQLSSLEQQREKVTEELEKARHEQTVLSGTLGVADTAGNDADPYDAQLADLRAQLAVARNAHAVAEAQLASVDGKEGKAANSLDSAVDGMTRGDAELSAMRTTLGNRRGVLIAEMNGLTPENPLYKKDQAELDQLSQTIDNLSKQVTHKAGQNLRSQLALEVARTGDIQTRLEADLARQTALATSGTPRLQRAQDLAESIKLLQTRYADLDNAIHTLSLGQTPSFAAHLSLAATPPDKPMPSRKIIILGLALPVAVCFGVVAALVRQRLDPHVYIGEEVDRVVNFPPMAVLPDPGEVSSAVTEEFLFRLVAGLDQAHRVGGASTFIFTAVSEEARIDDLVSSVAAKMEELGYLTMTRSSAETMSPVELTERNTPPEWRSTKELSRTLGNAGMRVRRESLIDEHLERLKRQVDFLFIKAEPLRSSSETEFVVRLGDVTVLIVESGKTTREELRSSLSLVRRLKAPGLAVVVNDLKLHNADNGFIESVRLAERRQAPNRSTKSPGGILTVGQL